MRHHQGVEPQIEYDWRQDLQRIFPDLPPEDASERWKVVQETLHIGQVVHGRVIAKAPFGAWIDIGVGFPALLLITYIADLTPKQYQNDDWCPLHTNITCTIRALHEMKIALAAETSTPKSDEEKQP
ncbi:MAG TPA: hypothetical protein DCE42_11605 [Myxococcales bacterium]|nr:hypothetical protein [Deltaproteobacteria bacterium]MBU54794.1 hypothetical protein [Deltaproteobacteria bacterium]HAA55396.1 hypothetical protein [Myxococcales bacterium]